MSAIGHRRPATAARVLSVLGRGVITERRRRGHGIVKRLSDLNVEGRTVGRRLRGVVTIISRRIGGKVIRERRRVTALRNGCACCCVNVLSLLVLMLFYVFLRIVEGGGEASRLVKGLGAGGRRGVRLLARHHRAVRTVARRLQVPLTALGRRLNIVGGSSSSRVSVSLRTMTNVRRVLGSLLSCFELSGKGRAVVTGPFAIGKLKAELTSRFTKLTSGGKLILAIRESSSSVILNSGRGVREVMEGLLSGTLGFASTNSIALQLDCRNNVLFVSIRSAKAKVSRRRRRRVFSTFERLDGTTAGSKFNLKLSVIGGLINVVSKGVRLSDGGGINDAVAIRVPLPLIRRGSVRERGRVVKSGETRIIIVSSGRLVLRQVRNVFTRGKVEYSADVDVSRLLTGVHRGSCSVLFASLGVRNTGKCSILGVLQVSGVNGSQAVPIITIAKSTNVARSCLAKGNFSKYLSGPFSPGRLVTITGQFVRGRIGKGKGVSLVPLCRFNRGREAL